MFTSTFYSLRNKITHQTDGDNGDTLITDGAGNLSFARTTVYANVKKNVPR